MKLFDFEDLKDYLNLDVTEEKTDKLCFDSAYCTFENYIGYDITEHNFNEIQTVKDNCIYLSKNNIAEIINITDKLTNETIDNCLLDNANKKIIFSPIYNEQIVFINYNAGFTKETFPADLKEAIIKLFLTKKKSLALAINNEECTEPFLSEEIKSVFDRYAQKRF